MLSQSFFINWGEMMKLLGKIVRWILGVLWILCGVSAAGANCLETGILLGISGLLLLPPVINKIPEFRHKRGILTAGSIAVFFLSFVFIPLPDASEAVVVDDTADEAAQAKSEVKPEPASEPVQSQPAKPEPSAKKSKENAKDAKTAAKSEKKEEASEKFDKKALKEWLEEKLSQNESVTDKERKKWKKVKEEAFLPIWKEIVLEDVESLGNDYDRIVYHMEQAQDIYGALYGFEGNQISGIRQIVDDLSALLDENKQLRSKYSADLEKINANYQVASFYITQRLEQSYSDNILGRLQKEVDSYQPQNASDWVAYDVEYIWEDTPTAGDTFRIIHVDSLNPFPQQGAYEVAYYDTGSTTQISNSRGFVQEVPVYQMIENTTEFENDVSECLYINGLCMDNYHLLRQILSGEVLSEQDVSQLPTAEIDADGGKFFVGKWADANSEWLYMEITCKDGEHYQIEISDRLSSSEFVTWSFTGVYDARIDGLVYSGGKRCDLYQLEETVSYTDGKGTFLHGEGQSILWNDNKEGYGEYASFWQAE